MVVHLTLGSNWGYGLTFQLSIFGIIVQEHKAMQMIAWYIYMHTSLIHPITLVYYT